MGVPSPARPRWPLPGMAAPMAPPPPMVADAMTERAIARRERVVGLEVALLAAEVKFLEELIKAGILPEGARRQPTAHELRAGVRFAELDRIVNDAAALLARKADRVRDTTLDGLAELLADAFGEPDPYAILARLDALTDPTSGAVLPGLRDVVDEVAVELRDDLYATGRAGALEALDEARRQGIADALLPDVDDLDAMAPALDAAATTHAQRVAKAPVERLLTVAAEAGQRAATVQGATGGDVAAAALDAAEAASRAGTEDLARQAANVTHGLGRTAALNTGPAPREVYASELLDSNTCGPCSVVDGRTYASLEDALVDYPGAGGFVGCSGGSRCRGTLVLVHDTEAAPTLDNPGSGPGSPGGPADRTPRGPASPAPVSGPAATAPQLPDPGALVPPTSPTPVVTDTGATAMPVDDLEPPIDTVPPDTIERDPELATYTDDELEALLEDEFTDYDRRLAAADELDQRAAGNRSQVWDEAAEDAREAWESAGGYAADSFATTVTGKPKGRRIDRIKTEWLDKLHTDYLEAEDATRGILIRKDRVAEFTAKYGNNVETTLFEGPARIAYYYASPELRDHWENIGGRLTFAEFAEQSGITDAKTRKRAAAARAAREDAKNIAEEDPLRRRKRQQDAAARRRRPKTAGEKLEQEQRRRDRIKAQERKLRAEGGYTEVADEAAEAAAREAAERAAQEAAEEAARIAAEEAARAAALRIARIEEAATPQDVGDALQAAIGDRGTVTGFDLTTLDVEKVRKAALAVVRQFDTYPLVRANVTVTKIKNSRVMAQASAKYVQGTNRRELHDLELQVSASKLGKRSKLDSSFARDVEAGHFHQHDGDPLDYIIAHEFGHLVDFAGRSATGGINIDDLKLEMLEEAGIPKPERGHPLYHADAAAYFKANISGYGRQDRDELVAEAFADVAVNGDAAKPFSRKVVDAFTDRLEKRRGLPDA